MVSAGIFGEQQFFTVSYAYNHCRGNSGILGVSAYRTQEHPFFLVMDIFMTAGTAKTVLLIPGEQMKACNQGKGLFLWFKAAKYRDISKRKLWRPGSLEIRNQIIPGFIYGKQINIVLVNLRLCFCSIPKGGEGECPLRRICQNFVVLIMQNIVLFCWGNRLIFIVKNMVS